MATKISGVSVATPEDVDSLQSEIRDVTRRIDRITKDIDLRLSSTMRDIRVIRTDLEGQAARTRALEESINILDVILDDITMQVSRSGRLLENISDHVASGATILKDATGAIRQEAANETTRRQEFTGKLNQLLAEHKAQASALQQAFDTIETGLDRLLDTERKGVEEIRGAISMLHDTVAVVQSQTQVQFDGVTESLREMTQNRQEQAQEEASTLAQIHATQGVWNERLHAIQTSVHDIALTSQRTRSTQDVRLAQLRIARARALNEAAIRLVMQGEYAGSAALLEETNRIVPDDPVLQCNLAMAYLKNQDVERARTVLEQMRQMDAAGLPTLQSYGLFCIEQRDYGSAILYLEQVVEAQPDDALTWMNLGKAHFGVGAVVPAIQAWRQAQQLAQGFVSSDVAVSILLDEQDHLEASYE